MPEMWKQVSYLHLSSSCLLYTSGIAAFENAEDKTPYTFKEETIKEAGADSAALAADTDYAIVVIGQPYNGISGEGIDRKYLSLSEDQMDMVSTVAANYAKEGKKTIVVINTEYPVEAEALQNDENVSAIVFNACLLYTSRCV